MRRQLLIRKIKRVVYAILATIALLILIERIYNSKAEFQTTAEAGDYYGIIDAKFTKKEKFRDFKDICSIIEAHFPYFEVNKRLHNIDWLSNKSRYKRIIKNTKNDSEFFVAMDNILKELNDDNTFILTGDIYHRYIKHYYPERSKILINERSLARYDFNGNLDIDPNNNFIFHNGPVLDTKILIEDELAYMRVDAMSYYHIEEDYPKIKSFLKDVEDYDKLIIDIRGNKGGFDKYWENIVKLLINDTYSAEYYSFFKQTAKLTTDYFKVPNIKTIKDLDEKILEQFPEEIKRDFNFYKINRFELIPEEDINFKGKVYLLVDKEVISSAEKFAAFAKDTGFATLIGEKTGGGMTFEEIPMEYMPYGGYIITYSRELVMNSDGTINMEAKTTPNILIDDTTAKEDFNSDKCIQAVIKDRTE